MLHPVLQPDPVASLAMANGVFVPIQYAAAGAVLVLGGLVMYWWSCSGMKPRSRRRIRRANTMVLGTLTINAVHALSMVSVDHEPVQFVVSWSGVIMLSLFTIGLAFLDSVNNVRIHRREKQAMRHERLRIVDAMEQRLNSTGS